MELQKWKVIAQVLVNFLFLHILILFKICFSTGKIPEEIKALADAVCASQVPPGVIPEHRAMNKS